MACRDHAMSSALFISHVRWAFAVGRKIILFSNEPRAYNARHTDTRGWSPCGPRVSRHTHTGPPLTMPLTARARHSFANMPFARSPAAALPAARTRHR